MSRSLKIALSFLAVGIAWVVFGDQLMALLAESLTAGQQKIIDLVFITVAAIVVYLVAKEEGQKHAHSDEQYRRLFESNPNPLWIYNNATLRIVKINEAAIEKYGYSREKFVQMTIMDIRPPADRQRLTKTIRELNGETRLSGQWKHLKADGGAIEVSIVSYPIMFDGQPCSLVIATDVTELVEKEQKLQNAYQKIKTFNETLRQIAWSNSHEMRKPVCSIISLVSLLKHTDNNQERRQYLNLLETAATELDEVLKQNEKMTEVESAVETEVVL